MHKNIVIYYFSATGNTYLAARQMAETLAKKGNKVSLKHMENNTPSLLTKETILGLAFPVAAQGTYPLVWDFIRSLGNGDNREVFMLDTLASFSGGIVEPVGIFLKNKGFRLLGAKEIIMPSNFLRRRVETDKDFELVEKGLQAAERFAEDLLAGNAIWPTKSRKSIFFHLLNKLIYGSKIFSLIFSPRIIKEKCSGCGICVEACPANCIELIKETAVIHNSCQVCMRCYGICPNNAITKKATKPYAATNLLEMIKNEHTF